MPRTPLWPLKRVIGLLRRADKRLFELAIRWPTLSDEQISRALGALDGAPPVAQLPATRLAAPTSSAIAEAEERLRRIQLVRQEREASRWWQRRLRAGELSLPFAAWTVFARNEDGEWVPSIACGEREAAEGAASTLKASGAQCALVAWDPDGAGRLVPCR
jgi:hypothetical protein